MTKIRLLLLCAVASTAFPAAHAQVTATAAINDLQFTLKDLRPLDFNAASLTWSSDPWGKTTTSNTSDSTLGTIWLKPDGSLDKLSYIGYTVQGYDTKQYTFDSSSATGTFSQASANSTASLSHADLQVGGDSYAQAGISGDFQLSAYTSLTISALAAVRVNGALPMDAQNPAGLGSYFSGSSNAYITVRDADDVIVPLNHSDHISVSIAENDEGVPVGDGLTRLISVTYVNDTNAPVFSHISVGTQIIADFKKGTAYLTSPQGPVPESSTWAQMALGLGGLAWLINRRKVAGAKTLA